MGIGNGQAKLLKKLYEYEKDFSDKNICELGAQVPLIDEIADLIELYGKHKATETISAKELYLNMGFSKYITIDINGEHEALKYDLNQDISKNYKYYEKFNVVTNFGTSEHCFNQFEVFKNMHNLCNIDGYMLHTVPTQGWGKHSFYKYDINFFEDLCSANGYKLLYIKPFLRIKPYLNNLENKLKDMQNMLNFINKENKNLINLDPYYEDYYIGEILQNLSYGTSLFNITTGCIIQKINENEFATPIQGMYQV